MPKTSRSLPVYKIRAHTISYSTLIETTYRFRDIADFDPPNLQLVPPQGMTPVEFRKHLWHPKTRVPGLSCDLLYVILRLAVLVDLRLVTDRRTDRQTDGHRVMASVGSRECTKIICHLNCRKVPSPIKRSPKISSSILEFKGQSCGLGHPKPPKMGFWS